MDLYGIGFANIRFAGDNINYVHEYSHRYNVFPEEVFLHEFIHTLERASMENGFDTVQLHDYEKYGYFEDNLIGLKDWYQDYMRCEILNKTTNQYVGLNEKVYYFKPPHENNFKYALEIEFNKEPENIIEEISQLVNVVIDAI